MKNKLVILSIIFSLVVLVFSSCEENLNCIEGNNKVITEERTTDPFKAVVSEGSFNIEVIQSTETRIIVQGESNLLNYIRTTVQGSVLTVDTRNNACFNSNYPINLTIYTPELESATLTGSGNIDCNQLLTDELFLNISGSGNIDFRAETTSINASIVGSGNINLRGVAINADFSITGSGSIFAYDLPVDVCSSRISGSGNMYLMVFDLLDIIISGSGSIFYKGNPQINSTISGSGTIVHV